MIYSVNDNNTGTKSVNGKCENLDGLNPCMKQTCFLAFIYFTDLHLINSVSYDLA